MKEYIEFGHNEKRMFGFFLMLAFLCALYIATLGTYLLSRHFFGVLTNFHLILIAGIVGGMWSHGLNRVTDIWHSIRDDTLVYTSKSFIITLIFSIAVIILGMIFSEYLIFVN